MQVPNLAVVPDCNADEFEEAQQLFIDQGLHPQQAVNALACHWTVLNNWDKALWQQQQQDAEVVQVTAQEREDQLKAQQDEDEAQTLWDEQKKNKSKFTPIPNQAVPSLPLILPSLVAIHKLKAHQFHELWYFTNTSLDEAEKTISYAADDNSLSIIPGADGTHSFIPSIVTQ